VSIFTELARRCRTAGPIRVAVVGTGYFGAGLVRRLEAIDGLEAAVAANRTLARAQDALLSAGVPADEIEVCDDAVDAWAALERGRRVATSSLVTAASLPGIDVVMEATGDPLVGTEVALEAIAAGKHLVAANPETQATVGPALQRLAEEAGVVYSDVMGDEPGNLAMLHEHCTRIGLEAVVAGNFKGVLKPYATPATQAAFAEAHGLKPWIAAAAADGTKLNFEMATVANAIGYRPPQPGMAGPEVDDLDSLVSEFDRLGLLERGPIVDYALGPFSGVFLIARSEDPVLRREFRYLKMGDGPYYLFTRPKLMLHYEAPLSAAEAALHDAATVAPGGAPVAEVVAVAKQQLPAGHKLDGIGGFDCRGMVMDARQAVLEGLLPMGISGFARLDRDVRRDEPVRWADVAFPEDNRLLVLRASQDAAYAGIGS
jgi:predicted homoserine dehydrogenase-like protein